jgi:ligand-binding sensor domain-containing protein
MVEYKERDSTTYEITALHKDSSGAVWKRILYRFWEVGDGDWKINVIEDDEPSPFAIYLPSQVVNKIITITVKNELKS